VEARENKMVLWGCDACLEASQTLMQILLSSYAPFYHEWGYWNWVM